MDYRITLQGEPKSTNSIYRSVCRGKFPTVYMSPEGKSLKESYGYQAKKQFKRKPISGDVSIEVDLYFGTHRKQDIDNYNKILFDSLSGVVWEDDSQIMQSLTSKHYDKENPRIEILITEYE